MITSDQLPDSAVDYLNEINVAAVDANQEITINAAKEGLLDYCLQFVKKSEDWRRASYETNWLKYQRNADGIFDPDISALKEKWQSKVHVGLTASHREMIHAHLFRTMAGIQPPIEVQARFDLGLQDQATNIRDIILREMEKADWAIAFNSVLEDADTYGSGFLRLSYETKVGERKLKKPVTERFADNLNPMGMTGYLRRAMGRQLKVTAYEEKVEEVILYRGLKINHLSIWDVFPDPKALKIPESTIAYRFHLTYGEIVAGVQKGYYLPEAVEKLKDVKSTGKFPAGEDVLQANRGVADDFAPKTDYSQSHEVYEVFGKMPKKWIFTILDMDVPEGMREELVPARVIVHKNCLIAVELNEEYDGEPPIYKMDYMRLNNSFYGRGIPEMLQDAQAVTNEIVNQRLDNGALSLNISLGVIERALVNPTQDLKSRPGQILRFDAKYVPNGDVRNVMSQLQVSDTPIRAGFSEVNEWERFAQERTSANRVSLGTAGLVKDSNQTLGGQQLLKESAGEKFAYLGLMMELSFLQEFYHGIWKIVYKNMEPEDIEDAIGAERMMGFIPMTPEEIQRDYVYKPLGIFTMENKAMRQNRLQQIRQQFLGAPWVNDEAFFDKICQTADEDPEVFKKQGDELMAGMERGVLPGEEAQPEEGLPPGGELPPEGPAPAQEQAPPMQMPYG